MKIAAWISAAIAALLIILGGIAFFFVPDMFGVRHPYNFFIVAITFLLAAIFCRMEHCCCHEKDKK